MALPYRGDGSDRPAGFVVPPERMPLWRDGRPLKQWRYVGVYGERLMLCAGVVRVGGMPQVFWAVWDRRREALRERTRLLRTRGFVSLAGGRVRIRDGAVEADLVVEPGAAVETLSPHGPSWIWTRKQGAVRVHGTVVLGGEHIDLDALGCVDDSAGYHARETAWMWSAGVGTLADGRPAGWNLVTGLHDAETNSERTVWVAGEPREVPPVTFADDLSGVETAAGSPPETSPEAPAGGLSLAFSAEATRARRDDLGFFASDYEQPFGTFSGVLGEGLALREGFGVMERHAARW